MDKALDILTLHTGLGREEIINRFSFIDKKVIDKLLKELAKSIDRSQVNMAKAELEAISDVSYSPRLIAREMSI